MGFQDVPKQAAQKPLYSLVLLVNNEPVEWGITVFLQIQGLQIMNHIQIYVIIFLFLNK